MMPGHPPAVRISDRGALPDADQRVMGLVHVLVGEETLIGRDQRQILGIGQIDQLALDLVLVLKEMSLQFDVEPPRKQTCQTVEHRRGIGLAARQEHAPDSPFEPRRQGDQPVGHTGQIFDRDLRFLLAGALHIGPADDPHEVPVAGLGLHEQNQLIGRDVLAADDPQPAPPRLGRSPDLELDADDRLHPGLHGRDRKFQRAEQVAGIGHRDRRHRLGLRQLRQILRLNRPLGERVGAVDAQMDEGRMRHGKLRDQLPITIPQHRRRVMRQHESRCRSRFRCNALLPGLAAKRPTRARHATSPQAKEAVRHRIGAVSIKPPESECH